MEPGSFVSYRACWPFLEGLEEVAAEVAGLVDTAPARAVTLYETFLAGCHEKAEEVDDSGGGFGMFVGELFCGWIRARQARRRGPRPDRGPSGVATMLVRPRQARAAPGTSRGSTRRRAPR